MDQFANTKDLLHLINGPIHKHQGFITRSKWTITRFKVKDSKETLNGLIVLILAKAKLGDLLEH
jgi:hypothetical protein